MVTSAIVLAAGQGQRMKSDLPKPLHKVCGIPMVKLIVDNVCAAGFDRVYLVVVTAETWCAKQYHTEYVVQEEQLGTGTR